MFPLEQHTIFLTLAGSQAHGTARDGSDVDLRGVCVAPLSLRLSLFRAFEQHEGGLPEPLAETVIPRIEGHPTASRALDVKTECVIFDIAKFVGLCAAANPNALEILFADERDWVFETPAWRRLHDERLRFLTKKVQQTFHGYAMAQLKKIKTHRSWLLNPPTKKPSRDDFGLPVAGGTLSRDDQNRIEQSIADKIRSYGIDNIDMPKPTRIAVQERLDAFYRDVLSATGDDLDKRMRAVATHGLHLPADVVSALNAEKKYRAAMKHWDSYQTWRTHRNPARAELERQHGYDTKHAMHLIRLMRMGLEVMEVLARVPADDLPWRHEGVLVLVSKGIGALRWRVVKANGVTKRALVLRDTPLLFAQSDEYWCPTCEKLLALGWGRDQVDEETLTLVRNASSNMEAPIHVLVDQISPVLRLLQEGVYLVSRVPHSPTNGAGEPFWGLSTELRPLEASKDWYFADLGLFELAQGYPAFLLPTQSLDHCNPDRVDEYRELAAQGQSLGGLALWVDGFLSALLDGHHRATAALLEKVPLTCLTIMSPTGVEVSDKEKLVRLWDARIPYSALPKGAIRVLEKQHLADGSDALLVAEGAAARRSSEAHASCDPSAMTAAAAAFPTAQGLAACSVAGDVSDQRIDELMAAGDSSAPQLWAILQALIASRNPRATALALRVGEGHWPDLWKDAFRYLATIRTKQVEDFFIEFLIRDEGLHPWLGDIADEYLAGNDARESDT